MRTSLIILLSLFIGFSALPNAAEINCPNGELVMANLGDGVTMRTCMWEKEPSVIIRTGPLELIKNGILILKTQTNLNGKLHGQFTTWNDAGEIIENGNYNNGLKEGVWLVKDKNGNGEILHYREGVLVEP